MQARTHPLQKAQRVGQPASETKAGAIALSLNPALAELLVIFTSLPFPVRSERSIYVATSVFRQL